MRKHQKVLKLLQAYAATGKVKCGSWVGHGWFYSWEGKGDLMWERVTFEEMGNANPAALAERIAKEWTRTAVNLANRGGS